MTALDQIKKEILKSVEEIEVDVTQLASYEYSPAVYSWQCSSCGPAEDDWDEQEEWQAKLEEAIKDLQGWGNLSDYAKVTMEEDEDMELKNKIICWLESLRR